MFQKKTLIVRLGRIWLCDCLMNILQTANTLEINHTVYVRQSDRVRAHYKIVCVCVCECVCVCVCELHLHSVTASFTLVSHIPGKAVVGLLTCRGHVYVMCTWW